MPPKVKVTRDDILDAALALVREEGTEALTTRAVAARLKCSTQPIFSNFPNMDGLRRAVLEKAYAMYAQRTFAAMQSGRFPPYKASGMAYIEFAVDEPQLFKLLYMRDRTGKEKNDDTAESEKIIAVMRERNGLSYDQARQLHTVLWVLVHGLAVMYATGFQEYKAEEASEILTDAYLGLLGRFQNKEGVVK